ncbi:MAG: glycosyltransferase family A protein [Odoribacter sp.]
MKVFERYFDRNQVMYFPDFPNDPEVIVIIPVFNDRDIFATLNSLCHCSCCCGHMGVIVVVNHSENCDECIKQANRDLAGEIRQYAGLPHPEAKVCIEVIEAYDLPARFAGVGLARKIAMDAAALFLYHREKTEQPILSLDADTLVEKNYTDAVLAFFRRNPVAGVSIAYAHRLEDCEGEIWEAMVKYELYLRYYQEALAYTGHPRAFHCIGSAFAVRASDYVAQGGMNKRQAGEDFYFLQKLISTGRYACLNTTRVYPSARYSARTPFGTGQAVRQIVENGGNFPVYHWGAFRDLKYFFKGIFNLYKVETPCIQNYFAIQAPGIQQFLMEIDGAGLIGEANANSASPTQFLRRFFDHFNAFRVLKYLNYVHGSFYQKIEITEAVKDLFEELQYPYTGLLDRELDFLRGR